MPELKESVERLYVFTQKELKEKLGIKGDIEDIAFHSGLSPNEKQEDVCKDKCTWQMLTTEKIQ